MTYIVDVFPIHLDLNSFPLVGFKIDSENAEKIGATFAARVRKLKHIPCAWVENEEYLVAPASLSIDDARAVLNELWKIGLEGFEVVSDVYLDETWQPSSNAVAQFVVKGALADARGKIKAALSTDRFVVKGVLVERDFAIKGIVVDGQPAIQVTIKSPLKSQKKLAQIYNPQRPESIVGLHVKCKDTTGKVERVVGELGQLRDKLKSYKPSDYDPKILESGQLPDDSVVVRIRRLFGQKVYDYPISVLEMVVGFDNLKQFGLTQDEIDDVTGRTKISPARRNTLVATVKDVAREFCQREYNVIDIGEAFQSNVSHHLFRAVEELNFNTQLCFGSDFAYVSKDTQMVATLQKYGLYKKAQRFEEQNTIRIAVVDVTGQADTTNRNSQLRRFMETLKSLEFEVKRAADPIKINTDKSEIELRAELISNIQNLIRSNPDIILIYLPQREKYRRDDDPQSLYNIAKGECVGAGIASQVIFEKTIENTYADDNIIMGILGKTGNIPYALADELEYTDIIVGLDVSRSVKKSGYGTDNTAAMSRIYTNKGIFQGYAVGPSMSVEGETIPQQVLERILPSSEFAGKRTIIHRDGNFVGDELNDILQWGKAINATFLPMEVTKSGAARLYSQNDSGNIAQVGKGTAFVTGPNSAYMVSTPPPSGKKGPFSTAMPLQIYNYSELTLEQALHSVLALTLLHYGSVRTPRLPVSTHASDKIAGFLRKNIRPHKSTGDVPFWL